MWSQYLTIVEVGSVYRRQWTIMRGVQWDTIGSNQIEVGVITKSFKPFVCLALMSQWHVHKVINICNVYNNSFLVVENEDYCPTYQGDIVWNNENMRRKKKGCPESTHIQTKIDTMNKISSVQIHSYKLSQCWSKIHNIIIGIRLSILLIFSLSPMSPSNQHIKLF